MKHAVGLHCQFMIDNGRLWDYLVSSGKPLSVFLVPELLVDNLESEGIRIYGNIHSAENHYPEQAKARFREHKDNPDITWIQEGYLHCCVKDFLRAELNDLKGKGRLPDYHHEHVCVSDGTAQGLFKQKEVIEKGKKLIEDELGIVVKNYCPANHLSNDDTLNAVNQLGHKSYMVRNGFDYWTKGLVSFPAYREKNGVVVVPESIIGEGEKSPLIGAYYDRLGDGRQSLDEFLRLLDKAVSLPELVKNAGEKNWKHDLSEKLVYESKKFRDFKKRFA